MAMNDFSVTPEMIGAVRAWRERPPHKQAAEPLVPHLRETFGLNYEQAQAVVLETNLRVMRAI